MRNKGTELRSGSNTTTPREKSLSAKAKPVALTVKVDDQTYVRLCTFAATQRRTNQDVLQQALHDYLERVGA